MSLKWRLRILRSVRKRKNPDFTNIHQRLDEAAEQGRARDAAFERGETKNRRRFWVGIIVPSVLSVLLIFPAAFYGAAVGVKADREAYHAYIDARRPCLFAEDQLFDLPAAWVEYYYDPETGELHDEANVTLTREGTWLFLYAIHVKNTRQGELRDLRVNVVLPGNAFVTTTDRREAEIAASEAERALIVGAGGLPTIITQDPRLTLARFAADDENLTETRLEMPSGALTPESWSHIFAWSPNVFGARGNQVVTYSLPVLRGGDEWWIGTWFYQPQPDWNEADKGATLTGWSQGYDGPLYAAEEISGLMGQPSGEELAAFCTWSE